MEQLRVRIVTNEEVVPLHYRMVLAAPSIARAIRPGQFVMVKCADAHVPLLRRPFSLHRVRRGTIEILYKVVGQGTEILSRRMAGDLLDVIGPLGNGFTPNRQTGEWFDKLTIPSEAGEPAKRISVLVAGGMGVAPLVALAEKLAHSGQRIAYRKKETVHVLIGAKTKNAILCEHEFRKLGCKVLIATEDGSRGGKGLATGLLGNLLSAKRYPLNAIMYACGPNAMLKEVSLLAERYRVPCRVSLEERMACGLGVCLGCPVKVRRSAGSPGLRLKPANRQAGKPVNYVYKMVCKDGPVFDAGSIVWD